MAKAAERFAPDVLYRALPEDIGVFVASVASLAVGEEALCALPFALTVR